MCGGSYPSGKMLGGRLHPLPSGPGVSAFTLLLQAFAGIYKWHTISTAVVERWTTVSTLTNTRYQSMDKCSTRFGSCYDQRPCSFFLCFFFFSYKTGYLDVGFLAYCQPAVLFGLSDTSDVPSRAQCVAFLKETASVETKQAALKLKHSVQKGACSPAVP